MAHFVNNPPDKVNLTAIRELNLLDANGTATVCVWGMPTGKFSQLRVKSGSSRFVGDRQRVDGNFSYYYCRGLQPGDEIAAFFFESDSDVRQHTGWLPVKQVKAYRSNPVPSAHKNTFKLDAYGSDQRHPAISEKDWIAGIENTLRTIKANSLGKILLDSITQPLTIQPYIGNDQNAFSDVCFTAQIWSGNAPGNRADEVLFHELVHVLEWQIGSNTEGYVDALPEVDPGTAGPPSTNPAFHWDKSDFLTVTATNLYSSLLGRKLRHDHQGFGQLDSRWQTDPARFRREQAANFATALGRVPLFVAALAVSGAMWNPFVANPIPPLIPGPSIPTVPHPLVPRPSQPVLPTPVPPPTPGAAIRNLSWGSKGTDVSRAQTALNNQLRPSPQLVTDGDFGKLTHQAVQNFQRQAKLDPDGVIGPFTRAALGI